jgi:hypothetical protein
MPSELRFRSASLRFAPAHYLWFRSGVLTASRAGRRGRQIWPCHFSIEDRRPCGIKSCGSSSAPIRDFRCAQCLRIVTHAHQDFPSSEDLLRLVWSRTDDQVNDRRMSIVVKLLVSWRCCPGNIDPDIHVGHEASGTHVDGKVELAQRDQPPLLLLDEGVGLEVQLDRPLMASPRPTD